MKIGDLVKYGEWYNGPTRYGLIVDQNNTCLDYFFVIWNNSEPEWEDVIELSVVD